MSTFVCECVNWFLASSVWANGNVFFPAFLPVVLSMVNIYCQRIWCATAFISADVAHQCFFCIYTLFYCILLFCVNMHRNVCVSVLLFCFHKCACSNKAYRKLQLRSSVHMVCMPVMLHYQLALWWKQLYLSVGCVFFSIWEKGN